MQKKIFLTDPQEQEKSVEWGALQSVMSGVVGLFVFSAFMGMLVEYSSCFNKKRGYYQLPEENGGQPLSEEQQEKIND